MLRRRTQLGNALAAVAFLAGCAAHPATTQPIGQDCGYVVMLPGISGGAWQFDRTVKGLREAKLAHQIEIVVWGTRPFGDLVNLTDLEANRKHADRIAAKLAAHHAQHPDDPITLIGFSGGGGLAMLVAEALPESVKLERIILVAAAIAPEHEVERAASRCRHGLVNFYSKMDVIILGAGTAIFGNIDRKRSEAAGRVGLRNADGQLRDGDRITQIPWTLAWVKHGHYGGHLGWLAQRWARTVLAPQIDPRLRETQPAVAPSTSGS